MRYFDENEPEAGYTIPKVARKRLTARSIKIFADGIVMQ
jgi:hypothetical protein